MSLEKNLKKLNAYHDALKKSKNAHVDVGVIANKLTRKIYDNNASVTEVALKHEIGTPTNPRRSFLKMPFKIKEKEIFQFIQKQYAFVFEGKLTLKEGLSFVGIFARNISVKAFETGGFGRWKELSPITIERKGSATKLVEGGTLKQSINWETKGVT